MKAFPSITFASSLFLASVASAETTVSVYGGIQENNSSTAHVTDIDGSKYNTEVDWDGNSFSMPPYYGFRVSQKINPDWALGVDYTHTKAYATADSMASAAFSTMEFTDGINILTANATRQFDLESDITPYVGLGVGVTIPHVELQSSQMNDKTFEYQLAGPAATAFAGVDYELSETWSVFSELKFDYHSINADMTDPSTDQSGSFETDIMSYAFNVGVSLSF